MHISLNRSNQLKRFLGLDLVYPETSRQIVFGWNSVCWLKISRIIMSIYLSTENVRPIRFLPSQNMQMAHLSSVGSGAESFSGRGTCVRKLSSNLRLLQLSKGASGVESKSDPSITLRLSRAKWKGLMQLERTHQGSRTNVSSESSEFQRKALAARLRPEQTNSSSELRATCHVLRFCINPCVLIGQIWQKNCLQIWIARPKDKIESGGLCEKDGRQLSD